MSLLSTTILFSIIWWSLFYFSFTFDRSKYRNCYLLFFALLSLIPPLLNAPAPYNRYVLLLGLGLTMLFILAAPVFLIINGIVMVRREGRHLSHLLSLVLGCLIFLAEVTGAVMVAVYYFNTFTMPQIALTGLTFAGLFLNTTVIYGSFCFFVFMIYTLFLHIIPRKKDFDYVIIHGAGLIEGERISKLLQDRVDKAIQIYRKDPTPPKIIPSGGKGPDENISEAEAMKQYLLSKGIPEDDIILEDRSKTTFENLAYSKEIIERDEGRKYTALVTSNYHVYRALRYCEKIGLQCTGVGSRVASYYWPSALIREFIAVHAEKKHAIIFIAGWLFSIAPLVLTIIAALNI